MVIICDNYSYNIKMNMYINNICSPILALTPFTETIIRTGEQGELGLSGPNVQLIAFNSGDDTLVINTSFAVGLGVARITTATTPILLSQLGIVMNQIGTLSNFEIGYSGRIINSRNLADDIQYTLFVIPSLNNSGNDYPLQGQIAVFSGILDFPTITSPEEISANKLIIIPVSPPNVNVGDRVVLLISIGTGSISPNFASLAVQASVHFTPSM